MTPPSEPTGMPGTSTSARMVRRGYLYALVTIIIWTGFILVSRLGGRSQLTSWDLMALRFGVSGTLLMPVMIWRGLGTVTSGRLVALVGAGGIGYGVCVYAAFRDAPAAHAGILLPGTMPFATALLALVLLGERLGRVKALSLLCIGAGVLAMGWQAWRTAATGSGSHVLRGDAMFLAASSAWCLFGVLLRRWQVAPWDATIATAVGTMLVYLPVYGACLPHRIARVPWSVLLLQGAYQGLLVVIIAMLCFARGVAALGPMRMALALSLIPVTAAVLAVPVLHEPITWSTIPGLVLVTVGAGIGSWHRPERTVDDPSVR